MYRNISNNIKLIDVHLYRNISFKKIKNIFFMFRSIIKIQKIMYIGDRSNLI